MQIKIVHDKTTLCYRWDIRIHEGDLERNARCRSVQLKEVNDLLLVVHLLIIGNEEFVLAGGELQDVVELDASKSLFVGRDGGREKKWDGAVDQHGFDQCCTCIGDAVAMAWCLEVLADKRCCASHRWCGR